MADKEMALYQRSARGFEPASDLAQEFWADCKIGDIVALDGRRPRNAIFLKLWWAMLNDMSRNSNPFVSAKKLNFVAKVGTQTGEWLHVYSAKEKRRVPVFEPGSISFAAMDEVQFRRFVKEAASFLCEQYFPGVVPDEFIHDFEQLAIG